MSYVIRCLNGAEPLWRETFSNEQDATHYWAHKAKLAQQYGPTATPFRFEFLKGDVLIDEFTTTGDGE